MLDNVSLVKKDVSAIKRRRRTTTRKFLHLNRKRERTQPMDCRCFLFQLFSFVETVERILDTFT